MSKNRHGGKKRQKQRRHFRRQVDIAYIRQEEEEHASAVYHSSSLGAYLCVHKSHLRGLRAQVKHFIIAAALSSPSLNNLLPSKSLGEQLSKPQQNNGLLLLYDRY